jgi:hypothetical protein
MTEQPRLMQTGRAPVALAWLLRNPVVTRSTLRTSSPPSPLT